MANNLNKLTAPRNAYADADTVNHEGFPAFTRSLREQYAQLLLTNTVGGTFYASETELVDQTFELHTRMLTDDPTFMAKAVVYARNESFMRLQPIVGLVYLSTLPDKTLFNKVFPKVIQTPGDLQDFVGLVRGGRIRKGLGRAVKEAINTYLLNLSEYHAIKYATGGQGYSLADIIKLTHPQPATYKQNLLFQWLLGKEDIPDQIAEFLPQIQQFLHLKNTRDDAEAIAAIQLGRLPHEVVTGVRKPSKAIWYELMRQMPTFALLRHLEKFTRDELWTDENVQFVIEKLNPIAIKNAKILPFRIWSAFAELSKSAGFAPRPLMNHLATLLDESAKDAIHIDGKVCISVDVSGSMDGAISDKSSVSYLQVGALFMAMVNLSCTDPILMEFDDSARVIDYLPPNVIPAIQQFRTKGGTDIGASIEYLLKHNIQVDVLVGITDSCDWAGRGFLNSWREYRKRYPQVRAYLLQIAPYRGTVAKDDEPGVTYIYGFNDSILKFIAMQEAGGVGQVGYIEGVAL